MQMNISRQNYKYVICEKTSDLAGVFLHRVKKFCGILPKTPTHLLETLKFVKKQDLIIKYLIKLFI